MLRDHRIKTDAKTLTKSLVDDWKEEHLFTLHQARQIYAHYQQMVTECVAQIAGLQSSTASASLSEVGPSVERFATKAALFGFQLTPLQPATWLVFEAVGFF